MEIIIGFCKAILYVGIRKNYRRQSYRYKVFFGRFKNHIVSNSRIHTGTNKYKLI